jgi:hypothetical protein
MKQTITISITIDREKFPQEDSWGSAVASTIKQNFISADFRFNSKDRPLIDILGETVGTWSVDGAPYG